MFPLNNRTLIRGFEAHVKAGLGGATDYVANYVDLFLPFDGTVETYYGTQGGNWLRLIRDNGDKIEFAHLSKYLIKPGRYTQGTRAAITGNTGQITTGPHLHIQIIRDGVRVDPETYDWNPIMVQYPIKIKLAINSKTEWQTINAKIGEISQWYDANSQGKLKLEFHVYYTNFESIPFKFFPDGSAVIDETWFDANVNDPLMDTSILVVRDEDLPDNFPGGFKLVARTSGFMGEKPTKTVVACGEDDQSEIYPQLNAFVDYVRHELMHTCYIFSGGHIGNEYFGTDQTHKYFYDLKNPDGAFTGLNYENIYKTLTKKKGIEMIVQKQGDGTLYLFGEGKLFPIATDYATFQKEFGTTPIAVIPPDQFAKYPVSTLKLKI